MIAMGSVRGQALGVLALAALAVAAFLAFPPPLAAFYPACPLRTWTGLACPICGLTRAVEALLGGRFAEAAHRNALAVVLLPAVLAMAAASVFSALRWNRWRPVRIGSRAARLLLLAAAAFGIARNLAPRLLGP